MSWNFDNGGDSKKAEFTKFPVGITRIRVIDNEPNARWTHWMPQHKRSINCPGKGCPICEIRRQQKANKEPYTYAMGRRFAVNIDNLETNKCEIMEQGIGFFEDLRDMKDEAEKQGNTLQDAIIQVRRRGTGKDDTSYRLDLKEIDVLNSSDKERLRDKATKLNEYFKPHTNEQIIRVINGEAWDEVMKSDQAADVSNSNEESEEFEIK